MKKRKLISATKGEAMKDAHYQHFSVGARMEGREPQADCRRIAGTPIAVDEGVPIPSNALVGDIDVADTVAM